MGGGHSAVRNGRVVRSGHDEGTQYNKQLIFVSRVLLRRVVQSAFRVSTAAARLPLGKEGQTYRRWIAVVLVSLQPYRYGCTWECTGRLG
eukprot:scaffold39817_cov43-Attheya_sp.AAC.1